MIVEEEFLAKLRRYFDLNLYEVKIWTALLSRGVSTAGELSDISNVPRSRSYDILESLEKKGFIVRKVGKPIKYIAVSPEEVVERVKKNFQKDANKAMQKLDELKDTEVLDELKDLHSDGIEMVDPTDLSGSLKGRHNLYNQLETMIKGAEETVTIMTTTEGLTRKVDALKPVLKKIEERGVKIRVAAPLSEEAEPAIKDLEGIAEIRDADTRARFCVVDGEELLFMMMDDSEVHPSYDVALWINTPFFSQALEEMFELAWEGMEKPKIES